jgi:uncharacterized protein (DUF1684 family)
MTRATRLLTATLVLLGAVGVHGISASDSYTAAVQKWRADYDVDLFAVDGPFSLVTRFVAMPGDQPSSIGSDPSNSFVLPIAAAPSRAGTIEWRGGSRATFRVTEGVHALVAGRAVSQVEISEPVIVVINDVRLRFRIRDAELRIAVHDANAAARTSSKPSVWFPIDPQYRIAAKWVPFPQPKVVRIADNDGSSREWQSPGYASFTLGGTPVTLQGVLEPNGKELSFFFRDRTAGTETYGAGRFLDTDLPKNGTVSLDFNKAYNPSCAFNSLYICPVPPRENHLAVRILAGERNYPHDDAH